MQKQLVVSPNSMTLEKLGDGNAQHFGEVNCPFCDAKIRLAINSDNLSMPTAVYVYDSCPHSRGAIAGHGYDVTVIFEK